MLLVLGGFILRESRQGYATSTERRFSDWLARNAEVPQEESPLALIEINDANQGLPLPPLDFALFLKAGVTFDPGLLAIEEVLAWPEGKKGGAEDSNRAILHDQILQSPKLLLGAQFGYLKDPDLIPPLQNVPALVQDHVRGDRSKLFEFPIVEKLPLEELRLSGVIGFTNLPLRETPVRTVPLLFRYCGQVVPSFVLQSAMLWLQLTPDDIQVELGSYIKLGDKLQIPIDDSGQMEVNPNARFTRIGLEELLVEVSQIESKSTPLVPVDALKEKLFFLARTDSAARTLMFPSGQLGSQGELFASAIATIQTQNFSTRAPLWVDFLLIGAVLVLAAYFYQLSATGAVFTALVAIPVYLMGAISLYAAAQVWLPIVLPFGLLGVALMLRLTSPLPEKESHESEF